MYKGKKILAIVPARGGSKGLPKKNIRLLLGKPLITWTLEQALQSAYIDDIFVSTDSLEIARVAEMTPGIKVPELRPAELASDTASSQSFIIYTINKLKEEGKRYDYFILLEPTSPLRDVEDIDKSISILIDHPKFESIVGICRAEDAHPAFMVSINGDGSLAPYEKEMKEVRRQVLPDVYFFEGSVYVSEVNAFLKKEIFYHDKTLPYVVPEWKSHEVDDYVDLVVIEAIMKLKLDGYFK